MKQSEDDSERPVSRDVTLRENLIMDTKWTSLPNRDRLTDLGKNLMITKRER